jgi:hypothetical protein
MLEGCNVMLCPLSFIGTGEQTRAFCTAFVVVLPSQCTTPPIQKNAVLWEGNEAEGSLDKAGRYTHTRRGIMTFLRP